MLARGREGGGGGGGSNERQHAEADYCDIDVDCRTDGRKEEEEEEEGEGKEHCCRWEKSSETNGALMDGDTRQLWRRAEGRGRREEGGAVNQLSLSPMDAYDRKGGEAMAWRVTPARSVYPTKPRPKL